MILKPLSKVPDDLGPPDTSIKRRVNFNTNNDYYRE